MHCVIYKSERKADTYLYIEQAENFSRVPQVLLDKLGLLTPILNLELTPSRKLISADVVVVMQQLRAQGYYLQLPPGKRADTLLASLQKRDG